MDRRIAKTQKALISALATCLSKHAWENVSVQLLCDTADVSRSTFYAHFDSKEELMTLGMKTMAGSLVADDADNRSLALNGKLSILPALLRHMRGHLFLFKTTRDSPVGRAIVLQFQSVIGDVIEAELKASPYGISLPHAHVRFLIGGLFALLDDWRNQDCEMTDAQVLVQLDEATMLVLKP